MSDDAQQVGDACVMPDGTTAGTLQAQSDGTFVCIANAPVEPKAGDVCTLPDGTTSGTLQAAEDGTLMCVPNPTAEEKVIPSSDSSSTDSSTATDSATSADQQASADQTTEDDAGDTAADDGAGYKGRFLAKEKIKGVTRDGDMNIVLLKSGQTIRLPDVLLGAMATDKPAQTSGLDLSVNQLRMMTIADAVVVLLRKVYMVNVGEVETFCEYLKTVVSNNWNLGTRLLWSGRNKYQVPLADLQAVLERNPEETAAAQAKLTADSIRNREIERNRAQ